MLGIFFVLAFAMTWSLFITVARWVPATTAPGQLLILLGAFAPAIAALSVTAWHDGAAGVRALLRPIALANVPGRYYVFATSYMAVSRLAAALLHRVVLGAWPRFSLAALVIAVPAVVISWPFQAGEEIGWRGYALPRLTARFGLRRASLLLGAIWAIWHLPQFYIADVDTYRQSFVVWSAQVVAMSVAFAWLYERTGGSLLLVMLLHSAINNTKDIVPSGVDVPAGVFSVHASAVSWLTLAVLWGCAVLLLWRGIAHRGNDAAGKSATIVVAVR